MTNKRGGLNRKQIRYFLDKKNPPIVIQKGDNTPNVVYFYAVVLKKPDTLPNVIYFCTVVDKLTVVDYESHLGSGYGSRSGSGY